MGPNILATTGIPLCLFYVYLSIFHNLNTKRPIPGRSVLSADPKRCFRQLILRDSPTIKKFD